MKKLILMTALIVAANTASYGQQEKTTMERLTAPEMWVYDGSTEDMLGFLEFTIDTMVKGQYFQGERKSGEDSFYLSDVIVDSFDSAKMRKVNNGKYIIQDNPKYKVMVYEILEISDTKLKIRAVDTLATTEWTAKFPDE